MSAASRERQRRYRRRQKAGRRVIMLEIDEVEVAAMLEKLRFLDPLSADDDEAVLQAFHKMVRVLCQGLGGDA